MGNNWVRIFRRGVGFAVLAVLLACSHAPLSAETSKRHETPVAISTSPQQSQSSIFIDEDWVGTDITYNALSVGPIVYIAYYNADRRLSVARIDTVKKTVSKKALDSVFEGWDTHNKITMAYDHNGYLHVSGNMHAVPLVYARTMKPNDFSSLTELDKMTGSDEESVTYPRFFFAGKDLMFSYRSGRAANGETLINRFDGQRWSRLLSDPLFAPSSKFNPVSAYPTPFAQGEDGYFHVAWVWRKARGSQNNSDVCYARSKDLVHWEDSRGRKLPLPITPATAEVVDAIPVEGGLLNNIKLGFDNSGKPIISYLKYDSQGNTQIYHARLEGRNWQIVQATNWKYRWNFSGGGTMATVVSFSGVQTENGKMVEDIFHKEYGSAQLILNPATLAGETAPINPLKAAAKKDRTNAPSASFHPKNIDIEPTSADSVRGQIRWQSLSQDNRDKPRTCDSIGLPSGCKMTSRMELFLDAH